MKICDYLISTRTYEMNLNKYINDYIIPILTKHNEEKKIKFDLNSDDKETKNDFSNYLMYYKYNTNYFSFHKTIYYSYYIY